MALFNKRQKDVAVKVLMETTLVRNWALGEARAFGVNPESEKGMKFLLDKRRELAERIVSTAK